MNEEPEVEVSEVTPEKVTIKESLEIIKGLDLLADTAVAVLADGAVNGSDLMIVVEKFKSLNVLVEAFEDSDKALAELKDLDQEELIQLGLAGYSLVKKVALAVKSKR